MSRDRVSRETANSRRSLLAFFALVFVFSVPFWLLGAATGIQLSADLPISSFIWICPVLAATVLVYRERGSGGVIALWRRSLDYDRITAASWLIPAIVLLPAVHAVTYGVMRWQGLPLPEVHFPLLPAVASFVAFFVAAQCEELGWSGYATDPLQARWPAVGAALMLGLVWAAFHFVPLVQAQRSPEWIGWWSLGTIALRVVLVWLYNNTGGSVFAVALCHAMGNLSQIGPFLDFGPGGYPLAAQRSDGLLLTAVALIVIAVWGPRTLARFRSG